MSCRVGSVAESALARPVIWKPLERIEPDSARPSNTSLLPELEEALEQCRAAQERLVELERSIEPMKKEAFERGFRAAQTEAQQATQREVEAERRRFATGITYMLRLRSEWRRVMESETVALAMAVARRVLNRELSIDPDAVQAIVKVALEKVHGQELRRVRVSPAQEANLRPLLEGAAPGVELLPDPALDIGDVRFELTEGAIDASVPAQLQEIERGLSDATGN